MTGVTDKVARVRAARWGRWVAPTTAVSGATALLVGITTPPPGRGRVVLAPTRATHAGPVPRPRPRARGQFGGQNPLLRTRDRHRLPTAAPAADHLSRATTAADAILARAIDWTLLALAVPAFSTWAWPRSPCPATAGSWGLAGGAIAIGGGAAYLAMAARASRRESPSSRFARPQPCQPQRRIDAAPPPCRHSPSTGRYGPPGE